MFTFFSLPLVQFHGDIIVLGVPLGDGNYHCFNGMDGCVFDLASKQLGDTRLDYSNCPEQERAVYFAKAEKKGTVRAAEIIKEFLQTKQR